MYTDARLSTSQSTKSQQAVAAVELRHSVLLAAHPVVGAAVRVEVEEEQVRLPLPVVQADVEEEQQALRFPVQLVLAVEAQVRLRLLQEHPPQVAQLRQQPVRVALVVVAGDKLADAAAHKLPAVAAEPAVAEVGLAVEAPLRVEVFAQVRRFPASRSLLRC